jgi:hypothetical protein
MREVEVIAPGTIDQVDPAEWNTPGNVRPDLDAVQHGRSSAIIWRPVRLTLDAPWKGTTDGATKAVVRGGTVGCDSYLFDDDPLLVPGDRYVLFLYAVTDSTGRPPGVMSVIDAWPIHADGTVERPVEVPIALDDLRKLFATPAR